MKWMIITCLCLAPAVCAILVQPASAQDQKQAIDDADKDKVDLAVGFPDFSRRYELRSE
jgi:hypothetical protein